MPDPTVYSPFVPQYPDSLPLRATGTPAVRRPAQHPFAQPPPLPHLAQRHNAPRPTQQPVPPPHAAVSSPHTAYHRPPTWNHKPTTTPGTQRRIRGVQLAILSALLLLTYCGSYLIAQWSGLNL